MILLALMKGFCDFVDWSQYRYFVVSMLTIFSITTKKNKNSLDKRIPTKKSCLFV
jgi:hypothetical protein